MSTAAIYEIIGYVGSGLVLVSFLMTSVVKLRLVNCVGGIIFAVYALLIHSYPTMIMNICLVLINLYYLWKLRNSEPNYRLVSLTPGGDYVDFFLREHREDIAKCFPGRNWVDGELNRAWLVCHGDTAAGLLLGTEKEGVLDASGRVIPLIDEASFHQLKADGTVSGGMLPKLGNAFEALRSGTSAVRICGESLSGGTLCHLRI